MANLLPRRGEVWLTAFNSAPPALGHEQVYPRPAVIVSIDAFAAGSSDLAVVLPITTTDRQNPLHLALRPPEGGILQPCFILCDQLTTVSQLRLRRRMGIVSTATMQEVGKRLRVILGV